MCEVFMPFNKSMIILVSTRYEIGRHEPARWRTWNKNLALLASKPWNIIAANNRYDAEYLKYFTDLRDVRVLPSYCGYVGVSYHPTQPQILVGPGRGVHPQLFRQLTVSSRSSPFTFVRIRDLYPQYSYADLAAHPAMVVLPYQVYICFGTLC